MPSSRDNPYQFNVQEHSRMTCVAELWSDQWNSSFSAIISLDENRPNLIGQIPCAATSSDVDVAVHTDHCPDNIILVGKYPL